MNKDNTVLGINIHLFMAVTCAIISVIDVFIAIDRFSKGQYCGVVDVIFAFWFGFISFIRWCDYKKRKVR